MVPPRWRCSPSPPALDPQVQPGATLRPVVAGGAIARHFAPVLPGHWGLPAEDWRIKQTCHDVAFKPTGVYFAGTALRLLGHLDVPGLTEGRPSLVAGDTGGWDSLACSGNNQHAMPELPVAAALHVIEPCTTNQPLLI